MRQISATGNCRGFTLLELMLVVLIIGMLAVTVTLALPDSLERQLETDARRLQGQLGLAIEQAIYRNQDYGLLIKPRAYRFFRRQGTEWVGVDQGSRLKEHPLVDGAELELVMEGMVLDGEPKQPQIFIVSDGQLSPFVLRLRHPRLERALQIQASYGGDLRLSEVRP